MDLDLSTDDLFGDIEPAELPDWLRPPEDDIELPEMEEAQADDSGLDWLQNLADEEVEAEETVEAQVDTPAAEESIPDEEDTQAWLEQQMDSFIEHRVQTDAEIEEEDMVPAVPGEVPDWLAEQMPSEQPAEDGELPDWLDAVAQEADVTEEDASDWLAELTEEDEAGLSPEILEEADILPAEEELPAGEPSELPAWLSELQESVEVSTEAEALDWLTEAQALSETEAPDIESEDITAWLREQEEAPLASTSETEPPDISWLEEEAPAETDLSWLEEGEADADMSWLEAVAEEEAPAPTAAPPAPAEPAQAVEFAPPPTPRRAGRLLPADVIELEPPGKVEASAEEVEQWLSQARAHKSKSDFEASMDHYERLVFTEQRIEELVSDLEDIARQLATNVRVRRLLGDAYMRQNRLQDALDAYRGALDQL